MRRKISKNPVIVLMVLIAVFSFITTFIIQRENNDSLEVYTTPDHVDVVQETEEKADYESQIFVDNENRFSISVPKDWQKVTKSGYPTFIHRDSGSSIQVQVRDYDPAINAVTPEGIAAELTNEGHSFVNFTRVNASQYEVLYQDYGNVVYDYIEEVYWDRNKIIVLLCTFDDANYEKLSLYYKTMLDTFVWDRSAPIPDGYYIAYIQDGGFEVGVPDTWVTGATDASFYAMDDATGAYMTVTPLRNIGYLDDFTSMDMTSLVQNGKPSFIMENFSTSHDAAYETSIFIQDNIQYRDYAVLYSKGTYSYLLEVIFENGSIDESIPQTCASLFNITIEDAGEVETHNESGFSQNFEDAVNNMTDGNSLQDEITEEDMKQPEIQNIFPEENAENTVNPEDTGSVEKQESTDKTESE